MVFFKKYLRVLLILIPFISFSQNVEFEHLSEDQGLVYNDVRAVTRDNEGFLWIGTKQGLDRFDGYSYKHYINEPENSNSLAENRIKCLFASADDKIYIGFFGRGFSIYDKRKENFENFSHDHEDENSLSHDTVLVFFADKNGILWIGTNSGLDSFDPTTKKIKRFFPFKDFTKKGVSGISDDDEGNLWLYGPSNRPCKFNPKENKFYYLNDPRLSYKESSGLEVPILHDGHQNLWFANEWDGLYKFNLISKNIEVIPVFNPATKSPLINCLTEDSDGNIWIGTEGEGVYKYNTKSKTLINYHYLANVTNNLTSNFITCIYESQPGIIWIGTRNFGINIWKRDKKKFEKFTIGGVEGQRLSNSSVLTIYPAENNKLWLGTDGGGLNLFDPKNKTFEYFTKENTPLCHNSIKSIWIDAAGTMWCGVYQLGLCTINFKFGTGNTYTKELLGNAKEGSPNCAWTLCKASNKKLYIGLLQGGLKVFDLTTNKFTNDFPQNEEFKKLTSFRIWSISEDSKKRIWISTENNGVLCFEPSTKRYHVFSHKDDDTTSLRSNNAKVVFEDSKGEIWVGNRGGLSKLTDFNKKQFVTYSKSQGLEHNNVKCIVEDKRGNLWLSTSKGISCFYVKEKKFRNFDIEDGLQGVNFHSNSCYESKEGVIYMGGSDGFNIFHPDSIRYDSIPPKIVITDFKIFDQSLTPNTTVDGKVYLKESIHYTKEIILNHSDNIFTIEFAALDFLSPFKNKYAYKMQGFNDKWVNVNSDKRIASYTNLDPGEYVFYVKGCNSDGFWSLEDTTLKITILPPIYMTWWFRLLCLTSITLSVSAFYMSRTRSIRKRNLELKNEVEKQTLELNKSYQKSRELYEEIKEGLEAGKIIQRAILPRNEILKDYFKGIEVLYLPKDLVSGDFYWFNIINNQPYLAIVDCTGHGVAGAFMTFIAYEILNQIARKSSTTDPGEIITSVNQEILASMNNYTSASVNAGMDIALCTFDKSKNTLFFSGANCPLYIVRGDEIIVCKGDRQGVGGRQKSKDYQFKTQEIIIEKGDQLYMFSDGYADQMGGENGEQKFLYTRFREQLLEIRRLSIQDRIFIIDKKFKSWKGSAEQLDDIVVVAFEL